MISIVICSIDSKKYEKLKKNIEETIGELSFEIIKIDNSIEKISITKAYNLGVDKSKYDILLFIHEDILFHTFNWGNILISKFKESSIGLLGIDAVARVGGAAIGTTLVLNDNLVALYLAAFSGIVIYLATSHILPEAHSRHSSRWTMVATIAAMQQLTLNGT